MIGWLEGKVIDKSQPGKIVLNVNGVGYDVDVSLNTFFQLESLQTPQAALHIHTVVREDAFMLFGFLEKKERWLFRTLIKVNGIGPKVAMAILSHATPHDLMQNVLQQNLTYLMKLPGIGKKTAERLLIELKDVFAQETHDFDPSSAAAANSSYTQAEEAISALMALGYKPQEASQVIKKLDDGQMNCEQLIRQALKRLAPA